MTLRFSPPWPPSILRAASLVVLLALIGGCPPPEVIPPAPPPATRSTPSTGTAAQVSPPAVQPDAKAADHLASDWISAGATAVSAIAAVAAAIAAWQSKISARESANQAQLALQNSTMQWCKEQYDDLQRAFVDPTVNGLDWFQKLWDMHFSEFYQYKLRSIPIEVYALWLLARWHDFAAAVDVKNTTQLAGWTQAAARIHDPSFETFINGLFALPAPLTRRDVQEYIKWHFPCN